MSYCLKYREKKDSKNPKDLKTKNRRIMASSNCGVCGKKPRFIKEQEANGILRSLGLRMPSRKIPLVGPTLF